MPPALRCGPLVFALVLGLALAPLPSGAGTAGLAELGGTLGRAIGQEARRLEDALIRRLGAPALAAWLVRSRDRAARDARPVPPGIRRALAGYVDEAVLDGARFTVGGNGMLDLAGLALDYGGLLTGEPPAAVTLVDVIVFADAEAARDAALWAHELFHVRQFRDWGTREFAIRYARDVRGVEDPAYAVQHAYASWRGSLGHGE